MRFSVAFVISIILSKEIKDSIFYSAFVTIMGVNAWLLLSLVIYILPINKHQEIIEVSKIHYDLNNECYVFTDSNDDYYYFMKEEYPYKQYGYSRDLITVVEDSSNVIEKYKEVPDNKIINYLFINCENEKYTIKTDNIKFIAGNK